MLPLPHPPPKAISLTLCDMKNPQSKIEAAASEAVKVIANAAAEAAHVISNSASEASRITAVKDSEDHDILITFRAETQVQMKGIRDDIKALADGTATRIASLESEKLNMRDSYCSLYKADVDKRLDGLETKTSSQGIIITKLWSYGVALLFVMGIVEFLVGKYL